MRYVKYLSLVLLFATCLLSQDISTPQKRMVSIDLARKLLTTESVIEAPEVLESKNPFLPKSLSQDLSPNHAVASVPVVAAIVDRDRLLLLAPQVVPTGSLQLSGKAMLLFGQKRLKVGDVIPIVFQGATYDLRISAIDRTTFTLNLNNEEIIRPIKSVTK